MERIAITVGYNLTEDEFSALSEKYPTGKYHTNDESEEGKRIKWFRVNIPSSKYGEEVTGVLTLTWFLG